VPTGSTKRVKEVKINSFLSRFSRLFIGCFNFNQPTEPEPVDEVIYVSDNHTLVSATGPTSTYVKCPWTCELTNDAGYVVYSALGSFYIPMLVMLFFYWRIYRAAIRTTRAINQGFRTTKGKRRTTTTSDLLFSSLLHNHASATYLNHSLFPSCTAEQFSTSSFPFHPLACFSSHSCFF
jgi:7 transmembrane receptor (rhodopsin family)